MTFRERRHSLKFTQTNTMTRCVAKTKTGRNCRCGAVSGGSLCATHRGSMTEAEAAEYLKATAMERPAMLSNIPLTFTRDGEVVFVFGGGGRVRVVGASEPEESMMAARLWADQRVARAEVVRLGVAEEAALEAYNKALEREATAYRVAWGSGSSWVVRSQRQEWERAVETRKLKWLRLEAVREELMLAMRRWRSGEPAE